MTSQEKAQKYFENNPSIEELFSTSDKTLFLRKIDAFNHAKSLEDQNVEDHENPKQSVKEVIVPMDFLGQSIPVIVGWMDNLTKDEIYSYLEAEKKNRNRTTLIKAFEEQLKKFDNQKTGEASQEDNNDNKLE